MPFCANGRPEGDGGPPWRPWRWLPEGRGRVKPARGPGLIPGEISRKSALARPAPPKGHDVTMPADERSRTRNDMAWAIAVGGIGVVLFTALLAFTWYFAATLLLIFAGMLLGVGLNALTNALGRRVHLPHPLRLAIVCTALALMLAGVAYLGGATIADQASVLSKTIKSQITTVRSFLENHGIDTSFFDLGSAPPASSTSDTVSTPAPSPAPHGQLPGAGALASSGGAIVSQTFKLLFGAIRAVGNIFIVPV